MLKYRSLTGVLDVQYTFYRSKQLVICVCWVPWFLVQFSSKARPKPALKSWILVLRNVFFFFLNYLNIYYNKCWNRLFIFFLTFFFFFLVRFYWLASHISASRHWQGFRSVISQDICSSFECVHSLEMEVVQIWALSAQLYSEEIHRGRFVNPCFTLCACAECNVGTNTRVCETNGNCTALYIA